VVDPGDTVSSAISAYLADAGARKPGPHHAYNEAELRGVGKRLPEVGSRSGTSLLVSDLTEDRVRTAFGVYIADHPDETITRASATWREFVAFLVREQAADAELANAVPPPPKRARERMMAGAAKTVAVTLLVPLLLFGSQQVISTYNESITNERNAQRERGRAARLATVSDTSDLLDRLSGLAAEVIYSTSEGEDLRADMTKIREELRTEMSPAGTTLTGWTTQFRELTYVDVNNVISLLNVLVESIDSVAIYVARPDIPPAVRTEMTNSLDVIEGGVRGIANEAVLHLLNCLVDYSESGANTVCGLDRERGHGEITAYRSLLESFANEVRLRRAAFRPVLPGVDESLAAPFQQLAREYSIWRAENESADPKQFPRYDDLEEALLSIDRPLRLGAATVPYSEAFLGRMADWMQLQLVLASDPAPTCTEGFTIPDETGCVGS
jgi:hypothetical protein